MKKQIKVTIAATVAMLALAGIAQATELNIYGASAQYLYWNSQAASFATTAVLNGGLGCTHADDAVNNGGKHGYVHATGCNPSLVPDGVIDIRYSGIASAEGPLAVKKAAPLDATLLTSDAGACNQSNGERAMYASSSTTVCKKVHIGTSDVAGESIVQSTSGHKFGPLGGDLFSPVLTGVITTDVYAANTVVVPFGFFVNSAVKARTCTAGYVGAYCTDDAQCNNGVATGSCPATSVTIDNISREQAVMLFSGVISNWTDFGAYFDSVPAVACLRHAGSGTHSAFDLMVMKSGWGGNVATAEIAGQIYFNQGSGDEIKCINGNSTATPTGSASVGAIGYADADTAIGVANTSQNVKQLKYNGVYPTRAAIRNGLYEFYGNAFMYTAKTDVDTTTKKLTDTLIAYAQSGANVPASKVNYWASINEMKFNRDGDTNYPQQAFPSETVAP